MSQHARTKKETRPMAVISVDGGDGWPCPKCHDRINTVPLVDLRRGVVPCPHCRSEIKVVQQKEA